MKMAELLPLKVYPFRLKTSENFRLLYIFCRLIVTKLFFIYLATLSDLLIVLLQCMQVIGILTASRKKNKNLPPKIITIIVVKMYQFGFMMSYGS